ncbi:5-formyltetrahydrofolate cyclo-ligase, mitochondrial [Turnera subulata]|uniref:5-formyltetrahydrofolate cyclo-ligase n=1 Tax=Turnera subulata TaxID=218843 RepID=A0A9Q0GJC0_9ROSI|nr:5-formyltetrahydrofolate cyclo-ligase, mitochondrial [Turnera subulata]
MFSSSGLNLRQRAAKLLQLMTHHCSFSTTSPPSLTHHHHHHHHHHHRLLPLSRRISLFCPTATMSSEAATQLDDIFKQKKALRTKVRKALKAMDPSLRSQEDDAIQSLVLEAPWFKSSKRLCAYISCSALREVDTSKLLSVILQKSVSDGGDRAAKKLYVPRVEDKNSHMRMLNISSMDDLIANSMDILEPAPVDNQGTEREDDSEAMLSSQFQFSFELCDKRNKIWLILFDAVMQASEPVDLFLLPGLAFDRTGRRLGRGGGYYDTFLRKYQELANERNWRQPLLVALSYSPQIMDNGVIPITLNDIPVDALVSPSGVLPINPAALEKLH